MADIRINALATTAASTASDDFIAVDGSANGTRKLNAYSPTFGGNLTVNGAINAVGQSIVVSPSSGTAKGRINSDPFRADVIQVGSNWTGGAQDDATKPSWYWFFDSRVAGDAATLFRVPAGGSSTSALAISSTGATLAGNLTVSGTGNSSVAGTLLVATTTNSSNGKIQLADHTTSAGGIGFGTDVSLYRQDANTLVVQPTGSSKKVLLYGDGTNSGVFNALASFEAVYFDPANHAVKLATNGFTALTLDSSQRCILAGALRLNNAYTAGAPTATGYVTIQDSAGNTYKVLVGT